MGVEFAVAAFVTPILDRLPDNGGLGARSDGARLLGKVMPFRYIGSVVLGAVWAALAWGGVGRDSSSRPPPCSSSASSYRSPCFVPVNSRVAQWTHGSVPADRKQQLGRWDRFHFVRVGVIVTAFVLLVIGKG